MEILGVPFPFHFPFFLASTPYKLAVRRPPPPSTPFHSPPHRYLSRTAPPRNGRLAVPWPTTTSPPCAATAAAASSAPRAPDEDEARAILRAFLEVHGMGSALEERKALEIVGLLSSKLRSLHDSEQRLGVQLAQPQLIDLFTPYLRSILKEYGDILIVGGDDQLPSAPPGWEKKAEEARLIILRRQATAQLEMQLSEGFPPPHVLLLMNIGLDLCRIRSMIRVYPYLQSATIKQRLDRLMEFLISLGVSESRAPLILSRRPHLLFHSIEEIIMPSMAFLESKGMDKAKWPIIIDQCPAVLVQRKAKVEALVGYFSEMGLSPTEIGRILTYTPQILCCSIEAKIKPVNRFLLDAGFTMEEIRTMLLTSGSFYLNNLERNLKPKWEFLLMMGYTRSDFLKFPSYFKHSLKKMIKPRYVLAAKHGICCSLSQLLAPPDDEFLCFIGSSQDDH